MSTTVAPFHLLAKPAGAACNLDCAYCFFLSKEALYPGTRETAGTGTREIAGTGTHETAGTGTRLRMSDEVLEAYVAQLLAAHAPAEAAPGPAPEVTIAWQGGEPTLMGLDFFRRSVDVVGRHRRPGQVVAYTLQTNGTLLDDEWCAFFKEHGFLVGLSVDGPQPLHDAYRRNRGGEGTFAAVMRAWGLLQKHEVETNVLCTVHAANASQPLDVYRFFRDAMGARFLQFIPIVERVTPETRHLADAGWGSRPGGERPLYVQAGSGVTRRSVKPRQYGGFLTAVFDEWVRRDVGTVFVQAFDAALAAWYGAPAAVCIYDETCGRALALEHNGDLYACDHFVEPDYRLGNILETPLDELVASPQQQRFGLTKRDGLTRACRACDVLFACRGGCPRNRFVRTPDGEEGLNYLCAGYKLFYHHVDGPMRAMAELLRQGRAPAETMRRYAVEDARLRAAMATAGRSDPCPCGSGKPFRRCHGRGGRNP